MSDEAPETIEQRIKASLTNMTRVLTDARVNIGERRYAIEKAASAPLEKAGGASGGAAADHSNVLPSNDDVHTLFTMSGALFPPYDPEVLVTLFEHSNSLRSNVDAYSTNIESFGWRLEPVIDLDSASATEKVGDAIYLERLHEAERQAGAAAQAAYPTPEEIAKRILEVRALMRLEHARVTNFFEFCSAEMSFTQLRRLKRTDEETTGNAYWEVLRNAEGLPAQFVYVPAYSVRLIPIEHKHHEITVPQKVSELTYENVPQKRRFRRYVQVVLDRIVHFKEFGDPRVVSRKNGQEYTSVEELMRADAHDGPATELIHFRIHSPRSPYGIPRWIGNLLGVLGSRAAEEVNYLYFDNKAVPPLAVLVSGGKLAEASVKRLESYVKDNLRGKENFHRILVVEAEPAAGSGGLTDNGRVRLVMQPLREAQQQDALFQEYDERNIDKVGGSFRLPRLLRGDIRDFNRATADAALQFAEMQVFQPERQEFDDLINRRVLTAMRIRFWRFMSNSPVNRDPEQVASMSKAFGDLGAFTPNELRELAAEVFNREFKKIEEPWADQPLAITMAGMMPPEDAALASTMAPPNAGPDGGKTPVDPTSPTAPQKAGAPIDANGQRMRAIAAGLLRLRSSLEKAQQESFNRELKNALVAGEAENTVVIKLTKEEIDGLFEPGTPA